MLCIQSCLSRQEISATLHNSLIAVSPDPLFSEGLASETMLEHTAYRTLYLCDLHNKVKDSSGTTVIDNDKSYFESGQKFDKSRKCKVDKVAIWLHALLSATRLLILVPERYPQIICR